MDAAWCRKVVLRAARIRSQLVTENTRDAFRIWFDIVKGGDYPSRAHVSPYTLRHLLPNIVLLDVLYDPLDFRYRVVGTKADYFIGRPLTNLRFSEIPHQAPGSSIFAAHESVAKTGIPQAGRIPYVGPYSDFRELRDVMLPLFDHKGTVTHILNVIDFPVKKGDDRCDGNSDRQLRAD